MTRKQKKMLVRIAVSAALLIAAVLVPYQGLWRFALFLPAYFVIGWDVLWRAVRNIAHGQVFDENFLMALATVGAFGHCGRVPRGRVRHAVLPGGRAVPELRRGQVAAQSIASPDGHPPRLRQRGAGRPAGSRWTRRRWRWATSSSSRPGSGSPWTAWCWRAHPAWTPPPSPARAVPRDGAARGRASSAAASTMSGLLRVQVTKAFRGVHRVQNSGPGGELQQQKGQGRELHHQVCPVLHPRGGALRRWPWRVLPPAALLGGLDAAGCSRPSTFLVVSPAPARWSSPCP